MLKGETYHIPLHSNTVYKRPSMLNLTKDKRNNIIKHTCLRDTILAEKSVVSRSPNTHVSIENGQKNFTFLQTITPPGSSGVATYTPGGS